MMPSFFIRTFEWAAVEVSRYYGFTVLITGPAGILFGGWLATRMSRRGDEFINARMASLAFALLIVPATGATLLDDPWLALAAMGLVKFLSGLPMGVAVAAFHEITPNKLRAQATALYLFTINLIGLGMGPTSVALLTDYFFADEAMLRYSMAIIGFVACSLGLLLALFAAKRYRSLKQAPVGGALGAGVV